MPEPSPVTAVCDHLEQLHADGASEGPWQTDVVFWKLGSTRGQPDSWWWDVQDDAGTVAMIQTDGRGREDDDARANAALIVAAVNAVPELIAALRAVEALAEELEGWRKNAANYHENAWEPAVRSEARARAMAYERALTGIRTALATAPGL